MLALLPSVQGGVDPATGAVGTINWPPKGAKKLVYEATLTKERKLPKELAATVRAARKEAGLFAPKRVRRQRVEMTMRIVLDCRKKFVESTCQTRLKKQSLLLKVEKPRKKRGRTPKGKPAEAASNDVPMLGNDRRFVWGSPDKRGGKPIVVPLAALERSFSQRFDRKGKRGVETADQRRHFGDHLLPVLWNHPLPCWVGEVTDGVDLSGQAIISGKSLMREATRSLPLGYREADIEVRFHDASTSAFTLGYKLKVVQHVSQERDGKPLQGKSFRWQFDIEGKARYSVTRQIFLSIEEKVTAVPVDMPAAKMAQLRDEAFVGTIQIKLAKK